MKNSYLFFRFLIFLSVLLSSLPLAYGQDMEVSGKVTGPQGDGLPGVNIIEKGTVNGTVTDLDGNYSFTVGENATLVFSSVGYATQEMPLSGQSTIDITMTEDVQSLAEVIVIGYGEVEKRDATGAVASVKAEDFNRGVISSPEELIQGKTAGVQITSASGEPGAGVNIRIRGTSSVRGGNNPLFVVDGVPLSGADVSASGIDLGRGVSAAKNPLSFINPEDIASIDVLKDASATAIYGSRGANGVVLITTKSGQGQKHAIQYSTTLSVSRMAERYDLLDREQFLEGIEQTGGDRASQDFDHDTDWQDEVSRTSFSHQHNLSYANAFKTGNYRASLSYDNQQGIIKETGLERLTGRLNFNNSFLQEKLTFGAQLTFSRVNDEQAPITDNAGFEGDLLGATYMANPTWSNDPDEQVQGSIANPNSLLKYYQDETETDRALINLSLGYDIFKNLNFTVNAGFDWSESTRETAYGPQLITIGSIAGNGSAFIADIDNSSNLLEAFFNYEKDFSNASLSAVLGYSYQEFNRSGTTTMGWGFDDPNMDAMISDLDASANVIRNAIDLSYQQFGYDNDVFFINRLFPLPETVDISERPASSVKSVAGENFDETDELQSFFGRINYNISDKYLLTATLRADGSTKFGENNKYGFFPSAAVAWRLSEEDFMPDLFDDLKLRLGYGITGNQSIPHNLHQQRRRYRSIGTPDGLDIGDDGNINPPGLNSVAFNNPDLQWEQTSQWNAGVDFGFFNNRLNGTLDIYRKVTTDLLMQITAAQPSPQPFNWDNLDADVINRGVELTLNYMALLSEEASLDFGFNISYNKNKVENLLLAVKTGAISGQGLTGAFAQQIAEGHPLYAFYLREFLGFNEEGTNIYPGDLLDDQKFVGKSPIPEVNLGFSLNFSYQNWSLTTYLAGQFGHYIYNNTANAYFTKGSLGNGRNVIEEVLHSNESTGNNPDVSTRFLEKGDFLRLQNLNLGYNFNLSDSFIKSLNVYASGQNLFVITDYSGLDPEVNVNKEFNNNGVPSLGIDYTTYPRSRTFSLGLSATF